MSREFLAVTSEHAWTDEEVRKLEQFLGCDAVVHDTKPRQLVFPKSPLLITHNINDIRELVSLNFPDDVKVEMIML